MSDSERNAVVSTCDQSVGLTRAGIPATTFYDVMMVPDRTAIGYFGAGPAVLFVRRTDEKDAQAVANRHSVDLSSFSNPWGGSDLAQKKVALGVHDLDGRTAARGLGAVLRGDPFAVVAGRFRLQRIVAVKDQDPVARCTRSPVRRVLRSHPHRVCR